MPAATCPGSRESPDLNVDAIRDRMLPFYRTWLSIRELEAPSIAAINGHAIGAGLCLALACDIRYAARGAKLSAPFTQLGMHAGMAATYLLPEVVGTAAARDLLLTGRAVDGRRGLDARPGQRGVRAGRAARRGARRGVAGRGRGADREPAHQGGAARAGTAASRRRCSTKRSRSR